MIPFVAGVEGSLEVSGPRNGARGAVHETKTVQTNHDVVRLHACCVLGHAVSPLPEPTGENARRILEHPRANHAVKSLRALICD